MICKVQSLDTGILLSASTIKEKAEKESSQREMALASSRQMKHRWSKKDPQALDWHKSSRDLLELEGPWKQDNELTVVTV